MCFSFCFPCRCCIWKSFHCFSDGSWKCCWCSLLGSESVFCVLFFVFLFFFFLGHDKGLRGSGKSAINFTMLGAECRFRSMISPRGSDNCRLSIVDLYLCAFDNAFLNSGSRSLCCLLMNFPLFHRSRFPLDCCRGVAPDWVPKWGGGS